MHGISNVSQIEFTFKETDKNMAVFKGKLTVDRQDFGIEGPMMAFMVGDEFEVDIEVQVRK